MGLAMICIRIKSAKYVNISIDDYGRLLFQNKIVSRRKQLQDNIITSLTQPHK